MYNDIIIDYNSNITMPYVDSYEDSFKLTKYLENITNCTNIKVKLEEIIQYLEHELSTKCKMISTGQTHLDYLKEGI